MLLKLYISQEIHGHFINAIIYFVVFQAYIVYHVIMLRNFMSTALQRKYLLSCLYKSKVVFKMNL